MKLNIGKFNAQIQTLNGLLKAVDLLEEFNQYPDEVKLSLSELRNLNYHELWKYYLSKNCYDFQLIDGSLICFNLEHYSFTFLGSPYDSLTFIDFLHENGFGEDRDGYALYPEYEQYVSECAFREFPFSMRYDFDANSYTEGVHPASHIHLGIGNHSRIGIHYLLDPESFVFFLIRQFYPDYWNNVLKIPKYAKKLRAYKPKLNSINNCHFNLLDSCEMYLK